MRYSETEGFEYDRYRSGAWRYRDYIITSFNDDKPFDRFVMEQLAGDELAETLETAKADERSRGQNKPDGDTLRIAAGFHRLGPVRRNAGNQELAFSRTEVLTEMADSAGAVFLGLTVACARCHDHKFDEISLEDYYRFQAFWAATHEHDIVKASPAEQTAWKEKTGQIQAEIKQLQKSMAGLVGNARLQAEEKLKGLEERLPPPLPAVSTVRNVASQRTTIHVLKRGNSDKKGLEVGPKLLDIGFTGKIASLPADAANPRTVLARAHDPPGQPARGARAGKPHLAVALRYWDCGHGERLRGQRRPTEPSGTTRLARERTGEPGEATIRRPPCLERQAHPQADCVEQHLSPGIKTSRCEDWSRERSIDSAALALPATPAYRRGSSRLNAHAFRPTESQGGWAERGHSDRQ